MSDEANKVAVLIMAGGSGSRLWPLSRKKQPKQSHKIFSNTSTFEHLLNMVMRFVPLENIYVTVGAYQYEYVKGTQILEKNVLLQHRNKNTGPAILYSVNRIREDLGDCTVAMLPSDHLIVDEDLYLKAIETAIQGAVEMRTLIAIGTKPLFPSTGFGYIEVNGDREGLQELVAFKEKPSGEVAARYAVANHLWNCGIYVCQSQVLLEAYKKFQPELYVALGHKESFFEQVKSISFDYGITEKMETMYVVKSRHTWIDIGTYEFLEYHMDKDEHNNTVHGQGLFFDSESTSVISESGTVVTFGTENILIVKTEDIVFVCDKTLLQKIGQLVDRIRDNGGENLL